MRLFLTQPTLASGGADDPLAILKDLLARHGAPFRERDLLVLPEHWYPGADHDAYLRAAQSVASLAGCHVVAGSQHQVDRKTAVNTGVVVDPSGTVLCRYEKLRPYALERQRVRPGTLLGEFELDGKAFAVMVCADFWFSDVFHRLTRLPDVILVPALSVTRKPSPDYSRALWRHLACARAYEFGAYVGISDWSAQSSLAPLRAAGVAGFADPTTSQPDAFFRPAEAGFCWVNLDFTALDAFRADRRHRGFFWNPEAPASSEP